MLRLQDMTSDPVELAFIQSIDGSKQLEVILERAEIPRDKARLLLVALSEAGMLQRHEATTKKKARRAGRAAGVVAAGAGRARRAAARRPRRSRAASCR